MSVPVIEVRKGQCRDIPAVAGFDVTGQTDPKRNDLILRAKEREAFWVAEMDSQVRAYATGSTFMGFDFLELVYVDQACRRMGLASCILDVVEKSCTTGKLFTSTNKSNFPMKKWLARRGFSECGIVHHLDESDPEIFYFKYVNITPSRTGIAQDDRSGKLRSAPDG